jgi:tetratricopeptide (TPR) repeat protein
MSDIHVTRELLKAVSRGELPPSVLARVGWEHLMSLCPCCHEEYAAWQKEEAAAARPGAYDSLQALPHLLERQSRDMEEKHEAAMKDLDELLSAPQKDRLLKIQRSTKRFRGLTLARMLLDESRKNVPTQPLAAQELAEVAHAILLRTSERPGINDLLARAAALRGNALRATGNLQEAEERIAWARSIIQQRGVTDHLVYAEVDWFEGALRKDQRRFGEAEAMLIRSAAMFHLAGERIEAARALLSLGLMYYDHQELQKAAEVTQAALLGLSPEAEPQLYLCGRHNLALILCETGQYEAAADALDADENLYRQFADAWTRLRQLWLVGKIAARSGRLEEAEHAFAEVRKGFIGEGIGYDAAMVSLDLALLYVRQGRTGELRQLAGEMHAIFSAEDVHREAIAALLFFEEAVRQDRATVRVIEDLAAFLKRARSNPSLRFEQIGK